MIPQLQDAHDRTADAARRSGSRHYLWVLYVVSFLDLFAVSMIIPSLSSYVKAMDGGAVAFGGIMSMYGFIQLFSAPIAGSLSDVYGRRTVLLVCILGAAVGYLLLACSSTIWMVIASRIPAALFKHTLDLIKVAITDAHAPSQRSAAVGRLNAASSAGFIVGPVIGGYVSAMPHGFNYTALLTTVVFGVNYVLLSVFYHENVDSFAKKHDQPTVVNWHQVLIDAKAKVFEFRAMVHEPGPAKMLLVARLLMAMAAILYRTHFSTLLEDKFGSDSKTRGMVLGYMGLLGACGSFAVGFATRWMQSELLLLQLASLVYVATFVALSHVNSLVGIYLMLVPHVVSVSMLRASSIALQTTLVSHERVGAFMGISSSLTSLARTISPSTFSWSFWPVWYLTHVCFVVLSGWTYVVSVDGPAYGAACLASMSAAMFLFAPQFAVLKTKPSS